MPATEVQPELEPRAFNFLNVAARECIGAAILGALRYRVIVNKWPIYKRHVMLVSDELRAQVLLRADLTAAAMFLQQAELPCLFFNSWSAGASVNHFHFQAMDQRVPIMDCEVVVVPPCDNAPSSAPALQLRGFAAHHTVVRLLPKTSPVDAAAAPAGKESAFTDAGVEQLWRLVSAMQAANQPHNVFFFDGLAVVVGRNVDPRRRGRFHQGCGGIDLGCNELAGWFTAFTREAFDAQA